MHVFNIDDYHSIHSYKRSNTTSLSNIYHIATCVAKRINNCAPILAIFNDISFFNPLNIDASLINKYLLKKYNKTFDIKLLTIHIYNDTICEQKEERSIENVQIVDIEKYRLKSTTDYIKALSMITQIPSLYKYLEYNILSVVADRPGQLYI
ncbi:8847_t:CDS:2 [Scutellospora calospora]|uniref:8847_t:CDS:1 n=1 Tax=Scutellospora calospora TaxID=85575 RepID=A0ACA9MLC9_9GLOM|nr:8847_t:CDS:2 [Scutellospora calospora]